MSLNFCGRSENETGELSRKAMMLFPAGLREAITVNEEWERGLKGHGISGIESE